MVGLGSIVDIFREAPPEETRPEDSRVISSGEDASLLALEKPIGEGLYKRKYSLTLDVGGWIEIEGEYNENITMEDV